jgi:hypothetical protein
MSEIRTGKMYISCDDCGATADGPPPPRDWTTVRVTSTDPDHGETIAWNFCPRCIVVVEPGEQEEPGFVDDVC